ncbi:helix-turn-helix domain-containing protein [Brucepastera parasyntrophica]|uniref:helix-turn-helix domain-containing protein n=1 Tax=Brucepastera parasyntrophica TaxID=2880008 RepID=UPI0034E1F7D7|nr:helix-turn-helix domain-containing protein [Brucepastera parasyntrophica]
MFYTVGQTAAYLHLKTYQVQYLVLMGYIEAIKIGRVWRICPKSVGDYAERHYKK